MSRGSLFGRSALAAVLLLSIVGCDGPDKTPSKIDRSQLEVVPTPDLGKATGAVLEQITSQQAMLADKLASPAVSDAELGQAFGDVGMLYIAYTFLDAAEVCFRNAQRLMPQDHRWPYTLGYLFQTQGRAEEAKQALSRALELAPRDLPSLIRLGTIHFDQGDNQKAREVFERAYKVDPKAPAVLDGLGKVAAALGEHAKAVDYFERTIALQPSASSVRHGLGLAYRNLGDLEKAKKNLEKTGDALVLFEDPVLAEMAELSRSAEFYLVIGGEAMTEGRYDVAAGQYRHALEHDPANFLARKALGYSLQKLGDTDGAIEQLRLALEKGTTGDAAKDAAERSEVYRILGGLMVTKGRDDEAILDFEKAIEIEPDNLDARGKLANALARKGRFEAALPHYDRILKQLPDHTETRVQRATALVNLGRAKEAIADYRRAIAADPKNPELRLRYADALEFLGDRQAAAAERGAVAGLPLEDSRQAEMLAIEAQKLQRAGDFTAAIERYRRALELAPKLIAARYEMGALLGHQGRIEEALAAFRLVIEADPHHAGARRGEVTALLLTGRYGEARQQLNEALRFMPRDSQLAHTLARLLAVAPDARVRDGQLAIDLAQRVHAARREAETAQTLAMAYAEAGQLDRALEVQREQGGAGERAGEHLRAYEEGRPWRAASPEEILVAMEASTPVGAGRG